MVWGNFWSKHDFEVLSIPQFGGDRAGLGANQAGSSRFKSGARGGARGGSRIFGAIAL
ncbi:MAG: hypothetical protein ACRC8Y_02240 [Chroococcales cyanobacterium]